MTPRIERIGDRPIVTGAMDARMGTNVNGPSLVRVPDWVANPLGRYYLYFAHHQGTYIRMAYADAVAGPWTMHTPGVLDLADSLFPATADAIGLGRSTYGLDEDDYPHIASPDVHVCADSREFRMYYHGRLESGNQMTRVARSGDGLVFEALPDLLGASYFRVFRHGGWHYAIEMPGLVRRSRDGLTGFEPGPTLFDPTMRHCAVRVAGDALDVYFTRAGDAPERILHARVDLRPDWTAWRATEPVTVLEPERDWEGAGEPIVASERGAVHHPVRELRDPCVFDDGEHAYLLYCGAGEACIGLAEIVG